MKMRKLLVLLAVILCIQPSLAQKKIIFEKLHVVSSIGPTMLYLKNAGIRKTIASQLSQTLTRFGYPALADTNDIATVDFPARMIRLTTADIAYTDPDASNLHLYVELYETLPSFFFRSSEWSTVDTLLQARSRSVFILKASLFGHDKKQLFAEELTIAVSVAETNAMGVLYNTRMGRMHLTPKGFSEMLRSSMQFLFDPKNELGLIEIKAAPVFVAENYISPKIYDKPRTQVSTTKNISRFVYNQQNKMLRFGDAVYEEIILKGKKAPVYSKDLLEAIRGRENLSSSDFVFLREECRDVLRDKNYLLKLVVQMDPANMRPEPYSFTNFLPGNHHYLFLEKDTLAGFSIITELNNDKNMVNPAKVTNGIDTVPFVLNTPVRPYAVTHEYIVKGVIGKQSFTIKCSGNRNTVKEIFLGDQLVCIAQGKFSPEKFVVFDASLSPDLLNQLFMIGFNRFLE